MQWIPKTAQYLYETMLSFVANLDKSQYYLI